MDVKVLKNPAWDKISIPDQAAYLMNMAKIPLEYRPEMAIYLQEEIKNSGNSFKQLVELYGHPCTKDLLGSSIVGLKSRIEALKPPVLDEQEFKGHRQNLLKALARTLGSGFKIIMKNELEYSPSGVPIGVGEATRDRHSLCDNALSGRPFPADYTRKGGLKRRRRNVKNKRKTLRRKRNRNMHRF
jgi:hypothetical protein